MTEDQSLAVTNVRCASYYMLRTSATCGHCRVSTPLLALALPCNHESLNVEEQDDTDDIELPVSDAWQRASCNAVLFYIEHLSPSVQQHLAEHSRLFRLARSAATHSCYWANHCQHCAVLLEDHDLHCEPGGAFVPCDEAAAEKIQLVDIQLPFEASVTGYSPEPEFLRFATKT